MSRDFLVHKEKTQLRIFKPQLKKIEHLCDLFLKLKKKHIKFHSRDKVKRIKRKRLHIKNIHRVGRFWVTRGKNILNTSYRYLFQKAMGINYCYIVFSLAHNVKVGLSADLLSAYLVTKIKQGFGIRSLIRT